MLMSSFSPYNRILIKYKVRKRNGHVNEFFHKVFFLSLLKSTINLFFEGKKCTSKGFNSLFLIPISMT